MKLQNPGFFISHREIFLPAVRIYFKKVGNSILIPKISRFLNKLLYKLGLGFALNRYNNSLTIFSSNSDRKLYEKFDKKSIFCNFGSGAFFHCRWKNYDYRGQSKYYRSLQGNENRDFFHIDLCAKNLFIPEADNSVSLIYCSHTLEHLAKKASKRFLKECFRILKPSAVMRIALPRTSTDFYYLSLSETQNLEKGHQSDLMRESAYNVLSDTTFFNNEDLSLMIKESKFDASKFYEISLREGISNKFNSKNPERHLTFWDYESLTKLSRELGFSKCMPFYRGSSFVKPFTNINIFDTTEPHYSFYTELVK